jgi:hypothetical protein
VLRSAVQETQIRVLIVEMRFVRVVFDQSDEFTGHANPIVLRWDARVTTWHPNDDIDVNITLLSDTGKCEAGAPTLRIHSALINNSSH